MTKLVGIFGYPLGHSISPVFQQAAFDHYAMRVEYMAWPTPPEKLREEVSKLRSDQFLGANVTVPHKVAVFDYLDDTDSWAKSIGAVNTIVREDGKLIGYNTDAYGFMKPLREQGEFEPQGKSALLLGAGGAARAAAFALVREGIGSLTIANRTIERAEALARDAICFRSSLGEVLEQCQTPDDPLLEGPSAIVSQVNTTSIDHESLENACFGVDLIVNSTSMGMKGSSAERKSPLEARMISPNALVYDMVYNPPDTPLLVEAGRAGAKILSGLPMLIYQGAAAFERWTGKEPPIEVMFRAGERALRRLAV